MVVPSNALTPSEPPPADLRLRPLHAGDLPAAAGVSAAAFELDLSPPEVAEHWHERVAHAWRTDPDGGFVAERDGRLVGVAQAIQRERLWCLALLTVQPGAQSAGAGRALLQRALAYGDGSGPGLVVSSSDPRALRLYVLAGFAPRPTFDAVGSLDRRSLPRPHPDVRDGGPADLEALAAISREVRGGPHTSELEFALGSGSRLLRLADRGFAVATPGHGAWLLVARDVPAATALLWSALEIAGEAERPLVRWITAEQGWAIDVAVQAGLGLTPFGALCVRGRPGTLCPFLPSGPFA